MSKPFASTGETRVKQQTLEVLADGVYAVTAEGDPNFGAVEGEDFLVCFEALATPTVARRTLAMVRSTPTSRCATWSCRTTTRPASSERAPSSPT
ncbi:hypothetical protein ACR6C2_36590 [Streptomyces sp. INA 01156]